MRVRSEVGKREKGEKRIEREVREWKREEEREREKGRGEIDWKEGGRRVETMTLSSALITPTPPSAAVW